MIAAIYFVLCSLETFLLTAYLILVGSTPEQSLIFNLSFSRLVTTLVVFTVGIVFSFYAFRSISKNNSFQKGLERFLKHEKLLWIVIAVCVLITAFVMFLLTRQLNAFGDFKLVYQRLEAVLVWIMVLCVQTAFFIAVWYSTFFIRRDEQADYNAQMKELLPIFGLFTLFVVIKLMFVTSTSYGPLGRGDEMTYFDMSDSLYRGFFSVAQSHHYPPLYPLAIVPTLVFKGWTFEGIKLLNAILSSSIVFPVYFVSRNFVDRKKSLIAAFLACLIPYHLVFPKRILSENLFFPLFLWTMFIVYSQPRNRKFSLHWDVLTGVMITALYLTRYITLAIIPFFLLAWWVKPDNENRKLLKPGWKKIGHLVVLLGSMLLTYSPWIIQGLHEKVPLKLILGFTITSRTTPEQLTLGNLLIWVVLYACYYLLVAAPVLHLLILSLWTIDYQGWRIGFERWIFQVLAIMGGFYVAVTRHSWRAYYNAVIPSAIMGRYLIVFSVIYFTIAIVVISKWEKQKMSSRRLMIPLTVLVAFTLVVFAYLTLVRGAIIPTDGGLLKSIGSVDAFFTEVLGVYFFVLLLLVYGSTTLFIWSGKPKHSLIALVLALVMYYATGVPAYNQNLIEYQTYPWLAAQIARLVEPPDPKSGEADQISVFLPEDRDPKNEAEIYNGLRVRGIDNTYIAVYSMEQVAEMTTRKGFIIQKVAKTSSIEKSTIPVYSFHGQYFTIELVER